MRFCDKSFFKNFTLVSNNTVQFSKKKKKKRSKPSNVFSSETKKEPSLSQEQGSFFFLNFLLDCDLKQYHKFKPKKKLNLKISLVN